MGLRCAAEVQGHSGGFVKAVRSWSKTQLKELNARLASKAWILKKDKESRHCLAPRVPNVLTQQVQVVLFSHQCVLKVTKNALRRRNFDPQCSWIHISKMLPNSF